MLLSLKLWLTHLLTRVKSRDASASKKRFLVMFYLIDVTNGNRRKVEISNGSRCVIDVRDRLLLQERVQLGRRTFYLFFFWKCLRENFKTCCKNSRWFLYSNSFNLDTLWMLAYTLHNLNMGFDASAFLRFFLRGSRKRKQSQKLWQSG